MAFSSEINKVLLVDGLSFIIPGISMFFAPSTHKQLKQNVESKIAAPALRDLSRGMGAAYITMGIFVIMVGYSVKSISELNNIAIFRAISLVFIVFANLLQWISKRWKLSGTQNMYTILYCLLILAYIYLGLIDPKIGI
jgi:predicted acyltransferase